MVDVDPSTGMAPAELVHQVMNVPIDLRQ